MGKGRLELSDVQPNRQQYKQASAVTDDEDSLQVYGGAKLLTDDNNAASGLRRRSGAGRQDNDDLHPGINDRAAGGTQLLTESDSDVEMKAGGQSRNHRGDENSSDEGLVTPKKVSTQKTLLFFITNRPLLFLRVLNT